MVGHFHMFLSRNKHSAKKRIGRGRKRDKEGEKRDRGTWTERENDRRKDRDTVRQTEREEEIHGKTER